MKYLVKLGQVLLYREMHAFDEFLFLDTVNYSDKIIVGFTLLPHLSFNPPILSLSLSFSLYLG